ncbi:MAG: adenosine deaminase, partial [Pseudomonadota bacterium]
MPDTATQSPKIELHLHLEGAAPPDFMRRLAGEQRTDISGIFDEAGQYSFKDFNDFLRVYEAATTLLKTPDDFARLLSAVAEELAQQGAIYAELFISPDFCGGGDLAAWREYLAAMEEAAVRARAIHG